VAYDIEVGGIQENLKKALRDRVQSKLSILNAGLTARSNTAYLVSDYGDVLDSHVLIGALKQVWKPEANGAIRIHIHNASDTSKNNFLSNQFVLGRSGLMYRFYTCISLYVHGDCTRNVLSESESEFEETLVDLFSDWLRACVFNAAEYPEIELLCSEFNTEPDVDIMQGAYLLSGETGYIGSGYNDSVQLLAVRTIHVCDIGGSYG
jgi:hypothetical protein